MGRWREGNSKCVLNSNAQKSFNKKNKENITNSQSQPVSSCSENTDHIMKEVKFTYSLCLPLSARSLPQRNQFSMPSCPDGNTHLSSLPCH